METSLPQQWPALCLLVFALGLRHGFDADHLATIDGLTRFNAAERPRLARWCGALFSLGHGAVVLAIALIVSAASGAFATPDWLEDFGNGVSILFLLALGLLNLHAVFSARPGQVVQPIGLKGRWLGRLNRAAHPGLVALVGALFALSFDTVSQAALFALAGVHHGGWQPALALGLIFLAGMLVVDGINGYWIARLLRRADAAAVAASRLMGLTVGILSLGVAAWAMAKWSLPTVSAWSEGRELLFSGAVVMLVGSAFLVAMRRARQAPLAVLHQE